MSTSKPLHKSRTIWVNALTMATAVLILIPDFLKDFGVNPELAVKISACIMLTNNIITIYLRTLNVAQNEPTLSNYTDEEIKPPTT